MSVGLLLKNATDIGTCLAEGAVLRWYGQVGERWERSVATERALRMAPTTPRAPWAAGLVRAEALVSGVAGLDKDEARSIVADTILACFAEDPEDVEPVAVSPKGTCTVNALRAPDAPAPEPTLRGAISVDVEERAKGKTGRLGYGE